MDIKRLGKGCLKQPTDIRDYRLELVAGAEPLPLEYSLRNNIEFVKHQDGSSSCVGQSFSYYAEMLNYLETGIWLKLSARDIYSLIFLGNGGAFIRDAASKITNSGVVPEINAPSYEDSNPPSEAFMRNRDDITSGEVEEGMTYLAKSYVTWSNSNFEQFKRAIYQGKGAVIAAWGNNYCWQNSIIQTPDSADQCDWGHAIYCCGWKVINGVEYLEFVNSWGEEWGDNGFGYLPKSYIEKGLVFNPITLIDLPNQTYNLQKQIISVLKNLIELTKQMIAKLLEAK